MADSDRLDLTTSQGNGTDRENDESAKPKRTWQLQRRGSGLGKLEQSAFLKGFRINSVLIFEMNRQGLTTDKAQGRLFKRYTHDNSLTRESERGECYLLTREIFVV